MTELTPEERRDAWLALVSQMEAQLLATRENAKAHVSLGRAWEASGVSSETHRVPEWEATRWAAQRLLEELKGLEPPVVPVDHERGQESLLELVPSTPGENPGDDGLRVHYRTPEGAMLHAVHNASRPPKTTEAQAEVTCRRCVVLLEQERQTCHATGPVPVTQDCGWEGCPLRGSQGSAACFLMGAGS